jgi:hypothetical protein
MTIFYPDIASYDAGISLHGALAVCCKVTEGTGYVNPDYSRAKTNAAANGAFFFAYHFLHAGNAAEQAKWCFEHNGRTPLMLDFEPIPQAPSFPSMADALVFVDEYRKLGGVIWLVYLPRWYWQEIGSPGLGGFKSRGLRLVSSDYTGYGTGAGWIAYGGIAPSIWQYSDSIHYNGFSVDFNAYKGTLAELKAIVSTGKKPVPPPPPSKAANPVRGLKTNAHWTQCDISWDATPGATEYRVNVWHGTGPTRWLVQRIDTTATHVTLFHLKEGTKYNVTVLAKPATVAAVLKGRASATFTTK